MLSREEKIARRKKAWYALQCRLEIADAIQDYFVKDLPKYINPSWSEILTGLLSKAQAYDELIKHKSLPPDTPLQRTSAVGASNNNMGLPVSHSIINKSKPKRFMP